MKYRYIEEKKENKNTMKRKKKTGQVFLPATHESMTLFAIE